MRRLVLVQLVMFLVIAAAVIPFGVRYVVGAQGFTDPIRLHATMADAFGLTPGTSVTVRGVQVGTVSDVRLEADGLAWITLDIDSGTQIPADSIMTVGMGTAAGIQSVDILPSRTDGPFLSSGDQIAAPADRQPVQMGQVMQDAAGLIGTIDVDSVRTVGAELSDAFTGLGPSLASLISDSATLSNQIATQTPQLTRLLDGTTALVTTMAARRDAFVAGMSASARLAVQLDESGPVLVHLTEKSPEALQRIQALFDKYSGTFGATLANLAVVTPIIGDRSDSLANGLVTVPLGLSDLTSIVKGDRADFALIATQGPICDFEVDRRIIGDVSPSQPNLAMYCPPAPNQQMRGPVNAPRPNDLGLQNYQTPGVTIGPEVVADPMRIPTAAELIAKWRDILKGGTNGSG